MPSLLDAAFVDLPAGESKRRKFGDAHLADNIAKDLEWQVCQRRHPERSLVAH